MEEVKLDDDTPAYVRTDFVRRVYALVSVQISVTAGVAALTHHVVQSPTLSLAGSGCAMACVLGTLCARGHHPWNLLLLAALSISEGLALHILAPVALPAAGSALTLFVLLTALSWRGVDCSFASAFLLTVGVCLPLVVVLPPIHSTLGALGVLIACLFVVHDTAALVDVYTPDEAVDAALQLYLDVVQLFVCLTAAE